MEAKDTLYEWTTTEYIEKKKSVDWFWPGIISVAAVVASIIYRNFLLQCLSSSARFLLVMFEEAKTGIYMSITTLGVGIDNYLYAYKTLKSFWLDTEHHRSYPCIQTDLYCSMIILLPAMPTIAGSVNFSKYIQKKSNPNSLTVMVDRLGL